MRLRRTLVSLALVALPAAAQRAESSPPILDVQLRVSARAPSEGRRQISALRRAAKQFQPWIQEIKPKAHKTQGARTI
jgi:hypothetical protein